jgi:hypothetical protein
MDIIGWTKKFFSKICAKIEDRLASFLAGGILVIALVVCTVFWEWLKTKHSLEMFGWLWILILLAIAGLPIFFFWLITRKSRKVAYADEDDIRNVLDARFREFSISRRGMQKSRLTISFALFDRRSNVKNGSSKEHLETIANSLGYYTVSKGDKTITLEYR